MASGRDTEEWLEGVRSIGAALDEQERARVAAMTISERLAHGVALSKLAIRLREAFREQARLHG